MSILDHFQSSVLMPYQREFILSRERYPLMLAHRRAGKSRAALTAALLSNAREYYVCSSDHARESMIAEAEKLTGIKAEGLTIAIPDGTEISFLYDAEDSLHGADGNVTLDEPYDADVFVSALQATQDDHVLRVVCSAFRRYSMPHQLTEGGMFNVYKTDIKRSVSQGFPASQDWANTLEEKQSVIYRQEYLCEHGADGIDTDPALLWYHCTYELSPARVIHTVHVPGTCREDAGRVFAAYPKQQGHERARMIDVVLSNTPILCADCDGASAVFKLHGRPGLFYCREHAHAHMQEGVNGHSLYVPPAEVA